jgi:hypothetical protein
MSHALADLGRKAGTDLRLGANFKIADTSAKSGKAHALRNSATGVQQEM